MLSIVSVVSVNLIALAGSASAGTDSITRVAASAPKSAIVATAAKYLGTRYRLGGVRPSAFDCSGFMRYVFARHGVTLPRTAREQSMVGRSVAVGPDSLRAGDLMFFRTKRGRASHVAMYVGNGRIIHASAGSRRIRYDDLDSPRGRWFIEHLTSVRRVLGPLDVEPDAGVRGARSEIVLVRSLARAGD